MLPESPGDYLLGIRADGFARVMADRKMLAMEFRTRGVEARLGAATRRRGRKWAATTQFSRAMAAELDPQRIRVNVIAPDTTPSAGNANALPPSIHAMNADIPAEWWAEAFKMYIPLQTPPSVDDLANAVLFLASDLAQSITGQVIHVDGGTSAALGMLRWPADGGITLPVPMGNTLKKLFG